MQASEALSELGFPLWLSAALGGSLAGYLRFCRIIHAGFIYFWI